MSNQNRFLIPHSSNNPNRSSTDRDGFVNKELLASGLTDTSSSSDPNKDQENNQLSVDTDFDSYWEEEARNPHRNRIRIGRQYQATVPPLLKSGEKDRRKLEDLETLSFCPKKSARISDAELDHYFTIAKSLNLFASLVETRSLLGRDVTIADLNHIRHKEGLSLASVIQPTRHAVSSNGGPNLTSPLNSTSQHQSGTSSSNPTASATTQSAQQSPPLNLEPPPSSSSSPRDIANLSNYTLNQPLMKALSHFISLHHPCHHDSKCKKLLKDMPLDEESKPTVSITAGNLRQGSSSFSSKDSKSSRSRSSLKQQIAVKEEYIPERDQDESQQASSDSAQAPTFEDWTKEEVELFSKAIEVCGKNFSSIKKEFLPSKSVRSIVEYYYIGSRDVSESKKKSSHLNTEANEGCSSPEKSQVNNNSQGGGSGSGSGTFFSAGKTGNNSGLTTTIATNSTTSSSSRTPTSVSTSTTSMTATTINLSNTKINLNGQIKSNSQELVNMKSDSKFLKSEAPGDIEFETRAKNCSKNMDPRMSVYNFDEELRDDASPIRFECPRPGAEIKPLKAQPIIPNSSIDTDPTNSNVGSLKFFMDGQLVLKLNACQEQQEGVEKCHWVQSGEKMSNSNKQKRYTKRAGDRSIDPNLNQNNGSQSNSIISSYQDDDSKNDDLTGDEDSKESMNSFTNFTQQQQQNQLQQPPQQQQHSPQQQQSPQQQHPPQQPFKTKSSSPASKRHKIKNEPNSQLPQLQQQSQQSVPNKLPSPINYNRMAVNNRMKERVADTISPNPMINQAMPWFQANSFAVAAALLGGLPFPQATQAAATGNSSTSLNINLANNNMASKPMDLSLEHATSKPLPKAAPTRPSRARPKNNQ